MSTSLSDPSVAKALLYTALTLLLEQWGRPGMAEARSALCAALARAKRALVGWDQHLERVHHAGLHTLTMRAETELERAEHFIHAIPGEKRREEAREQPSK